MTRGLVLGKFLPLHRGHLHLIREALRRCDHLTIVLGPRFDEPIAAAIRLAWLRETAPEATVVQVRDTLPSTPAHHPDFWRLWREALREVAPGTTHVFTSEAYGDQLARELGAEHVCVDLHRSTVPVSATGLRQALWEGWDLLAPPAQRTLLRRVALVGGESTGKTTLAEELAAHYRTTWVPEYGREHMDGRSIATYGLADAISIAKQQLAREEAARSGARGVLISDTEAIVTAAWTASCGLAVPREVWDAHDAAPHDLYLLMSPDLPWIQDGSRELPHRQAWFFEWIRAALRERRLPFVTISGHGPRRTAAAIEAIDAARERWERPLRRWIM